MSVELLLARGLVVDVYLGRHSSLQRAVSLRLLTSKFSDEPGLKDRFRRAAAELVSLRHPNILQVIEFDSVEERPYLVTEYVPGITLAAHLRQLHKSGGQLDPPTIERVFSAVAEAIQYAHLRGVIHQNLNPDNVFLTSPSAPVQAGRDLPDDVRVLVTDFGLAEFAGAARAPSNTQTARSRGYVSPEQLERAAVDHRTDLYSLGILLHELAYGKTPTEGEPPVPSAGAGGGSRPAAGSVDAEKLAQVIDRALQQDLSSRFQSAEELALAARAALLLPAATSLVSGTAHDSSGEPTVARRRPRMGTLLSTVIVGVALLVLVAVVGIRTWIAPAPPAAPVETTQPESPPSIAAAPATGAAVGVLRFQDGAAKVDKVTFNATGMPLPPEGSQYEIWLMTESGEERRSVGYLRLDADGNGSTSFVDAEGRNLLALYSGLEVTLEPDPDPNPNPTAVVAYATQLPSGGLMHVRHILVSFGRAPNGSALLQGLVTDAELVSTTARNMLELYEAGDEAGTRSAAEVLHNLVVGSQSPEYADWDADGAIEDVGDGYGMLLNGDQSGYIEGALAHAEFAATAAGATPQMQSHGEHVMVSTRNLEDWTPQLRDLVRQIIASPFDPSMGGIIRQAVALSDTILLGTDLNGNERVEAIAGEGGAQTAYQHALYMADMELTLQE